MKKLCFLLLTTLFLSCSKEEAIIEEKSHIIDPAFDVELMLGAWSYESVTINGKEQLYQHNPNCRQDVFAFFSTEGKLHDYTEIIHTEDHCATHSLNLEWDVNKDKIELFFGNQLAMTFTVLSLTESEFIVKATEVPSGGGSSTEVVIKAFRNDPYGWFEWD